MRTARHSRVLEARTPGRGDGVRRLIILDALDVLADKGVEAISIVENFGPRRSKRVAQTTTSMLDQQQALNCSIFIRKSRREDARQDFHNGGPVAFGYDAGMGRQDGQKQR